MYWYLFIVFFDTYDIIPVPYPLYVPVPAYLDSYWKNNDRYTLIALIRIIWQTLDNIDIFTLDKDKTPVSTNGVKAYSKEVLADKIRKFNTTNIQLI